MRATLEPDDIEAIAAMVAAKLAGTLQADRWMNADGAAEHLACPVSRIRKLTMTDSLRSYREGGRRLYRRSELDAFVAAGGASTH